MADDFKPPFGIRLDILRELIDGLSGRDELKSFLGEDPSKSIAAVSQDNDILFYIVGSEGNVPTVTGEDHETFLNAVDSVLRNVLPKG
ncbi:MAG: hypothetical protein GF416_02770 [Candidatus Altiarchaeales archaeon]|nr:hypothetical protein [Candidatus Altiarchaeales archaeon]MBD3416042.1 hypothetical protein [Candidatus Altiarchaeales archaeon]